MKRETERPRERGSEREEEKAKEIKIERERERERERARDFLSVISAKDAKHLVASLVKSECTQVVLERVETSCLPTGLP